MTVMKKKLIFYLVCVLLGTASQSLAKEWRGIVPLKTTRIEVEQVLGKPNELGRYQFDEERAYVLYAVSGCDTRAGKCQCLIKEGTVVEIHVTIERSMKFSRLKIDKSKFERTRNPVGLAVFEYSNSQDGIIYSVNEDTDLVVEISYVPAERDCENLIKRNAGIVSMGKPPVNLTKNAVSSPWIKPTFLEKLSPLHSTRKDVELILGPPKIVSVSGALRVYPRDNETISVRYVKESCGSRGSLWGVSIDTVEEIEIVPMTAVTLNDLNIDLKKYYKTESTHPERVFHYDTDGLSIQTRFRGDIEGVMFIKYVPKFEDEDLRCSRRRSPIYKGWIEKITSPAFINTMTEYAEVRLSFSYDDAEASSIPRLFFLGGSLACRNHEPDARKPTARQAKAYRTSI